MHNKAVKRMVKFEILTESKNWWKKNLIMVGTCYILIKPGQSIQVVQATDILFGHTIGWVAAKQYKQPSDVLH